MFSPLLLVGCIAFSTLCAIEGTPVDGTDMRDYLRSGHGTEMRGYRRSGIFRGLATLRQGNNEDKSLVNRHHTPPYISYNNVYRRLNQMINDDDKNDQANNGT